MHKLQIVHEDYLNSFLPYQATCFGRKFRKRDAWGFVDIKRSLDKFLDALLQDNPFLLTHLHLSLQLVC